jgi:hypothetical protein
MRRVSKIRINKINLFLFVHWYYHDGGWTAAHRWSECFTASAWLASALLPGAEPTGALSSPGAEPTAAAAEFVVAAAVAADSRPASTRCSAPSSLASGRRQPPSLSAPLRLNVSWQEQTPHR